MIASLPDIGFWFMLFVAGVLFFTGLIFVVWVNSPCKHDHVFDVHQGMTFGRFLLTVYGFSITALGIWLAWMIGG